MITSRQFAAKLTAITKSDDALRTAVCDALAFAVFHHTAHKNKDPLKRLHDAVSGIKWLSSALSKVQMPVMKKDYMEQDAEAFAVFSVRGIWDGQQVKREKARGERNNTPRNGKRTPPAAPPPQAPEAPQPDELTGSPMDEAVTGDTADGEAVEVLEITIPVGTCAMIGLDEVPLELTVDEYEAALRAVMEMRMAGRMLKAA